MGRQHDEKRAHPAGRRQRRGPRDRAARDAACGAARRRACGARRGEVLRALRVDDVPALGDAFTPTVIFLDVRMPKLDGFEVLRALRRAPHTRDIPVVMISTSSRPDDVRRAYELGANSYLVKRFDPDDRARARARRALLGRAERAAKRRDPAMAQLSALLVDDDDDFRDERSRLLVRARGLRDVRRRHARRGARTAGRGAARRRARRPGPARRRRPRPARPATTPAADAESSSSPATRRVDSAVEALRGGALDYLTKPVDLPRLQRVLAQRRAHARAAAARSARCAASCASSAASARMIGALAARCSRSTT